MHNVEWEPSASEQFAAICMDHIDRWKDIDAADANIEYKLRRNPLNHSQEVSEGLRRIISHPLVVYLSIDGNTVVIESVRWLES